MEITLSRTRGKKLLKELKREEKRLGEDIKTMIRSRNLNLELIELMKSGINQ